MKRAPIREIAILALTIIIFYKIYQSQFEYSMLDIFVWAALFILGFTLFLRTIYKESKVFAKEKKWYNFRITFICVLITGLATGFQAYVNSIFAKPSLLVADYYSEYLEATIDFKQDGSFIFDAGRLGDGRYVHGQYTMNGNSFILKNDINYIIYTKRLDVVEFQNFEQKGGTFLVQVDNNLKINETALKIPVIFDNRNAAGK